MTSLLLEPYLAQHARWPRDGRHVMAQFDDDAVVVYQAYRPSIGQFAASHGHFGGDFSPSRMSWIKPNFLWMMYRSGWGTKDGQEVVLAIWLRRAAFDQIVGQAIASSFDGSGFADSASWQHAVARSDVRLQWDPDHDPSGRPLARRAVQLGLRRDVLAQYARPWIVKIEDVSPFVAEQRDALRRGGVAALDLPREEAYPVSAEGRAALGM